MVDSIGDARIFYSNNNGIGWNMGTAQRKQEEMKCRQLTLFELFTIPMLEYSTDTFYQAKEASQNLAFFA